MLKRRVIIGLMFDDGVLVRTKHFKADYRYTQQFLAVDAIDEAILVDITRGGSSGKSAQAMAAFADRCFAPVTMGGSIKNLDDVARFFDLGADKVVVGSILHSDINIIPKIACKWGCQAVVAGIETLNGEVMNGRTYGAENPGQQKLGIGISAYARQLEAAGAGEIFLQCVDRDGSLAGFDLPCLGRVVRAVGVPVVVGTGCGGWRHMQEAFSAGADGAVTHCVHHWTETALMGFKRGLRAAGVQVRAA